MLIYWILVQGDRLKRFKDLCSNIPQQIRNASNVIFCFDIRSFSISTNFPSLYLISLDNTDYFCSRTTQDQLQVVNRSFFIFFQFLNFLCLRSANIRWIDADHSINYVRGQVPRKQNIYVLTNNTSGYVTSCGYACGFTLICEESV